MKKIIAFLGLIFLISFISANSINIEFPNGKEFSAEEPIIFKATIYNDSGNPIDGEIQITIEDSNKNTFYKIINSKELVTINLENAESGQGIITAEAENTKTIEFFIIGRKEIAEFKIENSKLIITNIGNTPYTKTIKITIGDTIGTQTPNLDIGESISYRLIAPKGTYNIKVEDGSSPSLIKSAIQLTGTGNVIGAIDETPSQRTSITGGVSPEQESDVALLSYVQKNKFIYVFIAVIFGAMILIAIERQYKKRI